MDLTTIMAKQYHIYIMTNVHHTVLYIGMTGNILRRGWEHKQKVNEGFTKKYNCTKMVYYENYDEVYDAIDREKQLKGWTRAKKEWLINRLNPEWRDVYEDLVR